MSLSIDAAKLHIFDETTKRKEEKYNFRMKCLANRKKGRTFAPDFGKSDAFDDAFLL